MKELIGRRDDGKYIVRCSECGALTYPVNNSMLQRGLSAPCQGCKTKTKHPLYVTWLNMRSRCNNPNSTSYPRYGAIGVVVCPEWDNDFWQFVEDMGEKPSPQHTLDKDIIKPGNKVYCKEFCKWATPSEQANASRQVKNAKGYYYSESRNRYRAVIRVDGKHVYLGDYKTEAEACHRYRIALHNKLNKSSIL